MKTLLTLSLAATPLISITAFCTAVLLLTAAVCVAVVVADFKGV